MGETLTQQRHVWDEAFRCVNHCRQGLIAPSGELNVPVEEAPANFVPAAAVIRGGLVLFGITGRKGSVGGSLSRMFNPGAQPRSCVRKLDFLNMTEVNGIPGVAVECVDIGRNTSCEGDSLGQY